jgi:uncharacterized protein
MERAEASITVEVAYSPAPRVVDRVELPLPLGATLADALRQSGLLGRHGLEVEALRCGIWGRVRPIETPLRDRDRVEIWRGLQVDPKEARRQRYRKHRGESAG